jgi:hypothetical protein
MIKKPYQISRTRCFLKRNQWKCIGPARRWFLSRRLRMCRVSRIVIMVDLSLVRWRVSFVQTLKTHTKSFCNLAVSHWSRSKNSFYKLPNKHKPYLPLTSKTHHPNPKLSPKHPPHASNKKVHSLKPISFPKSRGCCLKLMVSAMTLIKQVTC